jgi:hypothetical protein
VQDRKHKYLIFSRDDREFPKRIQQNHVARDFDNILEQSHCNIATLAAPLDIVAQIIASLAFFQYRLNQ